MHMTYSTCFFWIGELTSFHLIKAKEILTLAVKPGPEKFMTIEQPSLLAHIQGSKSLLLDTFCSPFQLVVNRIMITTKTNSHTK